MDRQELCSVARTMLKQAYAPYSRFPVGAALECSDGSVFTGCNIENAAFSPSICAERTAVAKAVSEGRRDFVRIAVAGSTEAFCPPCGVCRQVLAEFAGDDLEVLLVNSRGEIQVSTLGALLPGRFDGENLAGAQGQPEKSAGNCARRGKPAISTKSGRDDCSFC